MTPLFASNQSVDRAFERLYKAHVRDIYRYSLMVMRSPEDAEDVVQTTFLKAFRAFEAGERPRNGRHWLIKIAHNTCRTRIRDAKRRPQEVALEEQFIEAVETQDDDGVRPAELLRALGELTFNQRAGLVMRELEGRSYAEIAQVLELSPAAVETLLFRARRALREQLDGSLECGDAELALSRDLDGRLDGAERAHLRAHLRACRECSALARRQRARRAALGALGPVPLPGSLASWGGGAVAGAGVAAKVAAVVAAGAVAVGAGSEVARVVLEPAELDRVAIVTPAGARPAATTMAAARDAGRAAKPAPSGEPASSPATGAVLVPALLGPAGAEPSITTSAVAIVTTVVTATAVVSVPRPPTPPPLPVEVPPAPSLAVPAVPPVPPLPQLPPLPADPPPPPPLLELPEDVSVLP